MGKIRTDKDMRENKDYTHMNEGIRYRWTEEGTGQVRKQKNTVREKDVGDTEKQDMTHTGILSS